LHLTAERLRASLDNAVAVYCAAFKSYREAYPSVTPKDFAALARRVAPVCCLMVLEVIGSWPSSEPELAALQRLGP
jgi:hypothetical protein